MGAGWIETQLATHRRKTMPPPSPVLRSLALGVNQPPLDAAFAAAAAATLGERRGGVGAAGAMIKAWGKEEEEDEVMMLLLVATVVMDWEISFV